MDMSNMGNSNLDTGDNEPSMEDILASIRQIIADDEVEDTAEQLEIASEPEMMSEPEMLSEEDFVEAPETIETEAAQDMVVQLTETTDDDAQPTQGEDADILELMNFIDESLEEDLASDAQKLSADTTIDTVASTDGFDESLDLVMDAEASDYLTTKIGASAEPVEDEKFSLEDALFGDIGMQNGSGEESLVIPEIPKNATAGVEPETASIDPVVETDSTAAGQVQVGHDEDMDLVKSLLADLMDEPSEGETISTEDDGVDLHSDFEDALTDMNETAGASGEDADVDFVTGEVIDANAMDAIFDDDQLVIPEVATQEPEPEVTEAVEETVLERGDNVVQERDFITGELIDSIDEAAIFGDDTPSVLNEVLQKTVEDEVALHENLTGAPEDVAPEPVLELKIKDIDNSELINKVEVKIELEPELEPEPEIETESADSEIEGAVHDDDVVVLPEIDAGSKFSLLAKTTVGASALGLGAAAALMKKEVPKEEVHAAETPSTESEIPTLEKQELPSHNNKPEKDETMAQAAKTETILDTETVAGSASAFASLTTVVQEKIKMEESGPAIGDLVQEALKPMLKEWLDKNLKGIVERAVTKEVKRISSNK